MMINHMVGDDEDMGDVVKQTQVDVAMRSIRSYQIWEDYCYYY